MKALLIYRRVARTIFFPSSHLEFYRLFCILKYACSCSSGQRAHSFFFAFAYEEYLLVQALCLAIAGGECFSRPAAWAGTAADSLKITVTEGTNMAAVLSPDQKTIAIDLQGTIWVLPAGGGTARPVTDALGDCRQPAWSPDGNWIVFHAFWDGIYHLWMVNKDGSGKKQLTFGVFDDREPHWSPDGKHLVFSSDRSGNYDIWQLTLETAC